MEVLAATGLPTFFFLAILIACIGLLLMRSHRAFSRQARHQPAMVQVPRPKSEPGGYKPGAPAEMARWEVSMHDTARDLSAQLDSKMAALEQLIREADRAAARLEAALDRTQRQGEAEPHLAPFRPGNQAEALRALGSTAEKQSQTEPSRPAADVRYQEIYTLSDYGYPSSEIAQRIGSPVGEVELILSLRDKR